MVQALTIPDKLHKCYVNKIPVLSQIINLVSNVTSPENIIKIATVIIQNPRTAGETTGKVQINGHVNRQVTDVSTRVSINAGRRAKEQKQD